MARMFKDPPKKKKQAGRMQVRPLVERLPGFLPGIGPVDTVAVADNTRTQRTSPPATYTTTREMLPVWYGEDAGAVANLPGMRAVNLDQPIPGYVNPALLERDALGSFSPSKFEMQFVNKHFMQPTHNVYAHEMGHALMHQAGNPQNASDALSSMPDEIRSTMNSHTTGQYKADPVTGLPKTDMVEIPAIMLAYARTHRDGDGKRTFPHPTRHPQGFDAGMDALLTPRGGMHHNVRTIIDAAKKHEPMMKYLRGLFRSYGENRTQERNNSIG